MKVSSTTILIIITLLSFISFITSSLLITPASDTSVRVYGAIPLQTGNPYKKLKRITATTSEQSTSIVSLQYVQLDLFSLPKALDVQLEYSSANFDSKGTLTWDIDVELPPDNNGIVIDLEIFYKTIGSTDDKVISSNFIFEFIDIADRTETYKYELFYHHLKYDDTSQDFDLRFQTYLTQVEKSKNTNTLYRWSSLIFDTTRWVPKNIQLYLVGPLAFTTTPQIQLPTHERVQSQHEDETQLYLQPLLNTKIQSKEKITCWVNSLRHDAEIDLETNIITFLFNDIDVTLPYRGAISLSCPDIYVVQKYPETTSFTGATRSIAVISVYGEEDGLPLQSLDMRAQNVKLYEYAPFPTNIHGEGWIENEKVMATYIIEFDEKMEKQTNKRESLQFEWSKVILKDTINTFGLPVAVRTTTSPWATQSTHHINSKKKYVSPLQTKYDLFSIFNTDDMEVEDFVVQQYATVENKNPTINAVNVLRYQSNAKPMPALHTNINTNNTANNNNDNNNNKKFKFGQDYIQKNQINNSILQQYLRQHSTSKKQLTFDTLHQDQKYELLQLTQLHNTQPEAVYLGIVPQLVRYQSISEHVYFDDESSSFTFEINNVLGSFDTVQFLFPRGAAFFHGDFGSCQAIINHAQTTRLQLEKDGYDKWYINAPNNNNDSDNENVIDELTSTTTTTTSKPHYVDQLLGEITIDIAGKSFNGTTNGQLDELIFNLNPMGQIMQIGDTIKFQCLHGYISYRRKQPVFGKDFLTVQASTSANGTPRILNEPSVVETSLLNPLSKTNLHTPKSLLGLKGTQIYQTTVDFVPHEYQLSMFIMMIVLFSFVGFCLLAVFIMPILACCGVIQLDDSSSINSPQFTQSNNTSIQYNKTTDFSLAGSFPRQGSSSSIGLSPTPFQSPEKTTQYGTISTDMGDNSTTKPLKSILKTKHQ